MLTVNTAKVILANMISPPGFNWALFREWNNQIQKTSLIVDARSFAVNGLMM